jgi:hypothetical protein
VQRAADEHARQRAVDAAVSALEERGGVAAPVRSKLLDGTWRLLYVYNGVTPDTRREPPLQVRRCLLWRARAAVDA